jgi:hypothetical protein
LRRLLRQVTPTVPSFAALRSFLRRDGGLASLEATVPS